jgi:hypothetical protein
MFIPLDQIYNFFWQNIDHEDVVLYHFHPHGSKGLSNLFTTTDFSSLSWYQQNKKILLIMHDQEPLDFDLYSSVPGDDLSEITYRRSNSLMKKLGVWDFYLDDYATRNLFIFRGDDINDRFLLCHSEVNSRELEKYQNIGALGVYWWSHAMIARDWYRFAKIDRSLDYDLSDIKKDFNIYNRAWRGTREYRLKFTEMMLEENLQHTSSIKFSAVDGDCHYKDHIFKNAKFCVGRDLEILEPNSTAPSFSADYDSGDYQAHAIDVVLETIFDDQRIHLTEKILRPIACGKPFLLVSTPGALGYLRNYGFKTFDGIIDESYDLVEDPLERLGSIISTMKKISALSPDQKKDLYQKLHAIADFNKQLFWSEEFGNMIINELFGNYQRALEECRANQTGYHWQDLRTRLTQHSDTWRKHLSVSDEYQYRTRQDVINLWLEVHQNRSKQMQSTG